MVRRDEVNREYSGGSEILGHPVRIAGRAGVIVALDTAVTDL